MKRLAIIIAIAVVLFTGLLLLAPLFIPVDAARAKIAEQIEQWIGRPVSFSGEPSISFFPRPSVRLDNVIIEDRDGSGAIFIHVDELIGTFRLLPLLVGRVQASSFELRRPTIALRVDEDGRSNWAFEGTLGERIAEAQEIGGADSDVTEVALGTFRLVDGTITFEEPGAEMATLSQVALDFTWPSTAVAAFASGSVVWRGERVSISAMLAEPLELIAGRSSPGQFTVTGEPIGIVFDGWVGRNDLDLVLDGETRVEMDSLRRVVNWASASIGEGTTLADASIDGHARWDWPVLEFSNAEMALDGNKAIGAFSIDFSGERVDIDGTLALRSLDLTGYAEAFR
ncbi:MAG: AsmA family protein, partial [Alphaproteobacteria bacterium]